MKSVKQFCGVRREDGGWRMEDGAASGTVDGGWRMEDGEGPQLTAQGPPPRADRIRDQRRRQPTCASSPPPTAILNPPSSIHHAARGGGFTLVEVLLALALTGMLLGAVYAALSVYARLTVAGEDRVARQQLSRSIARSIESDVRSVVFRPAVDDLSDSGAQAADEDVLDLEDEAAMELEDDVIEVLDPAEAAAGGAIGVFGDANTLMLHVSRPSRELDYGTLADGAATSGRTSDMLSVAWYLATPGAGGLHGATADLAEGGALSKYTGDGSRGLARLEGDRLTMESADASGDLTLMAANAKIIAPEVNYLQFRYFDGAAWLDYWDTEQLGALPRAIEVTFGYRIPDDAGGPLLGTIEESVDVQRTVIALPLSQPVTTDAGF